MAKATLITFFLFLFFFYLSTLNRQLEPTRVTFVLDMSEWCYRERKKARHQTVCGPQSPPHHEWCLELRPLPLLSMWAEPAPVEEVAICPPLRPPPLVLPDEASPLPPVLPRRSSADLEESLALLLSSCDAPFIGPRTFLATLVSWVTKPPLSPGDTGRALLEEEGGFSSRTSRWTCAVWKEQNRDAYNMLWTGKECLRNNRIKKVN